VNQKLKYARISDLTVARMVKRLFEIEQSTTGSTKAYAAYCLERLMRIVRRSGWR
jgi:hypothetical protein